MTWSEEIKGSILTGSWLFLQSSWFNRNLRYSTRQYHSP